MKFMNLLFLLCEKFLKLQKTVDIGLVVQTAEWRKPDGMKQPIRARLLYPGRERIVDVAV